jgi:hypothetical protein
MFTIQAPAPALSRSAPCAYSTVSAAISKTIAPLTESMHWVWNELPLRIGYVDPFATVLGRIVLPLLELLLSKDEGTTPDGFHEHALVADWEVAWASGAIRIDSRWYEAGRLTTLLGERSRIEMPLADFIAEWKMPLRRIVDAFEAAGVEIERDDEGREDETHRRLLRVESSIPRFGRLYRAVAP